MSYHFIDRLIDRTIFKLSIARAPAYQFHESRIALRSQIAGDRSIAPITLLRSSSHHFASIEPPSLCFDRSPKPQALQARSIAPAPSHFQFRSITLSLSLPLRIDRSKKKRGGGIDHSIDSSSPKVASKKKGGRRNRSIDRLLLPPRFGSRGKAQTKALHFITKSKSSRTSHLFYPGSLAPQPKKKGGGGIDHSIDSSSPKVASKKKGGEGIDQSIDSSSPQGSDQSSQKAKVRGRVIFSTQVVCRPRQKKRRRRNRSIDRLLLLLSFKFQVPSSKFIHHQSIDRERNPELTNQINTG